MFENHGGKNHVFIVGQIRSDCLKDIQEMLLFFMLFTDLQRDSPSHLLLDIWIRWSINLCLDQTDPVRLCFGMKSENRLRDPIILNPIFNPDDNRIDTSVLNYLILD